MPSRGHSGDTDKVPLLCDPDTLPSEHEEIEALKMGTKESSEGSTLGSFFITFSLE